MMKIIRALISYFFVYAACVMLLMGFLLLSAFIPQKNIQKNMEESADILCEHNRIWYMIPGVESSQNHLYADAITLNIAYHFSKDNPIESVIWANYYSGDGDVNTSLRTAVKNQTGAETQYLRYWHGSAALVRFLHLFLNINRIYWLHGVMILGLIAALIMALLKKEMYAEAAAFALSMILVSIWFVPFCLEYFWTFLCMFIASLIGIKLVMKDKIRQIYYLFLVTGTVTVYLDFLSTETITLTVPLILILRTIKKSDSGFGYKKQWLFALKNSILWSVGYIGMWVSKWIIASVVLHENVMPYVTSHINDRIGGINPAKTLVGFVVGAVIRNVKCLFPFDYGMPGAVILLLMIFALIVLPIALNKVSLKNEINKQVIGQYILIGAIPILRFAVLHSHSWYHRCFTYRALAGTLLAVFCVIMEMVEWNKSNGHS